MAKIQVGKVVIGGIIAGIVINASDVLLNNVLLGDLNRQAVASSSPDMASLTVVALWRLLRGFVLGFLAMYVFAGIRPRFSASSHAAITAGLLVWMIHYAFNAVNRMVAGDIQVNLLLTVFAWSLAATVIATLLGAKLYPERAA